MPQITCPLPYGNRFVHRFRAVIAGIFSLIMTSGCQLGTTTHHGHYILPKNLALCLPMQSTQQDVLGILGSPTLISPHNPHTYYYLAQTNLHIPTKKSAMRERTCYVLEFSPQGVLQRITSSSPLVAFQPNRERTPMPSKYKESKLQQIFGSLKSADITPSL